MWSTSSRVLWPCSSLHRLASYGWWLYTPLTLKVLSVSALRVNGVLYLFVLWWRQPLCYKSVLVMYRLPSEVAFCLSCSSARARNSGSYRCSRPATVAPATTRPDLVEEAAASLLSVSCVCCASSSSSSAKGLVQADMSAPMRSLWCGDGRGRGGCLSVINVWGVMFNNGQGVRCVCLACVVHQ